MTALYVPQNRLKSLEQNTDEGTVDVHRNYGVQSPPKVNFGTQHRT